MVVTGRRREELAKGILHDGKRKNESARYVELLCPKMGAALTGLAERYGRSDEDGVTAKIKLEPYENLVYEQEGGQVCVGYYFEQNGDLVPDPMLWFRRVAGGLELFAIEGRLNSNYSVTAEDTWYAEQFAELIEARYLALGSEATRIIELESLTARQLEELGDKLDKALNRRGEGADSSWECNHDHRRVRRILAEMGSSPEVIDAAVEEFKSLGGYCDCEVMLNVVCLAT